MRSSFRRRFGRVQMSAEEQAAIAKPWFHNFAPLGFPTETANAGWHANQIEKQGPVFEHIRDALLRCPRAATGMELFANDGLFGLYALMQGAGKMDLFDTAVSREEYDPVRSEQTRAMAKLLGFAHQVTVRPLDPFEVSANYDFGICCTVLFHVPDPARLLHLLRSKIAGPLVIQNPVSLAEIGADYLESPALYRPWGSRFSQEWLVRAAVKAGWTIVSEHTVELPGNRSLADRGSASLLCV